MSRGAVSTPRADIGVGGLLALGTVLYLAVWPRDFVTGDEGLFLYEARRILAGEVIYRDFFDVIAPGSLYIVALAFRLFGISIETARLLMAAIHAGIVVIIYGICRALGVRRALAVPAASAHVALAYPALPIASPHWMGTLMTLVVLAVALRRPRYPGYKWCAALGLLCGVFAAVQHQKAGFVAAGAALVLVLDDLVVERRRLSGSTVVRLLVFAAGVLAIVAPLSMLLFATAGVRAVYDGLVLHPLSFYGDYNQARWGGYSRLVPSTTYVRPELISRLPYVVPLVWVQFVWHAVRRSDAQQLRPPMVLAAIGTAAIGSIWYLPNYIHLAMIAPICCVLLGAGSESLFRLAEQRLRAPRLAAQLLAAALCALLFVQAVQNRRDRRSLFPLSHETAFGRIDYRNEIEIALVDKLRELLGPGPQREFFCYTACASLYLTTDSHNPTRYQLLIPGYNRLDQLDEAVEVLKREQLPYVVAIRLGIKDPTVDDPMWTYLHSHYEFVRFWTKPTIPYGLMRRKEERGVSEP